MTAAPMARPRCCASVTPARARKVLDLPPAFRDAWRLSADNGLVLGASVPGAHKYYLPTHSVG